MSYPWRRLAGAILLRAARDALAGDLVARRWLLFDPLSRDLVDELGLRSVVWAWVVGLG